MKHWCRFREWKAKKTYDFILLNFLYLFPNCPSLRLPWPHKTLVVYCWGPNHRSREWLWYNFVLIWKNVCLLSHDWLPAHSATECPAHWSLRASQSEAVISSFHQWLSSKGEPQLTILSNSSQLHCKQLFVFTNCNYAQPLCRIKGFLWVLVGDLSENRKYSTSKYFNIINEWKWTNTPHIKYS